MDSLLPYLLLDAILLVIIWLALWRRLCFWHPAISYFLFHIYSFTYRGWKVFNGAPTMNEYVVNADSITIDEITRALLWADVGLVIFAIGAGFAHRHFDRLAEQPVWRTVLNRGIVFAICALCLPVGLFFLYSVKGGLLVFMEDSATVNYLQALCMWPIGCIGLIIFTQGFRWYWIVLLLAILGPVALQGYHRFMLVLPLLFFTSYYLCARRQRWPSLAILAVAFSLALVFPRLKFIGRAIDDGDIPYALTLVKESFVASNRYSEMEGGEDFLDQFAGSLTLIDNNDQKFFGSTYLALVTLPIPRAWWPGKPGLADHLAVISTPERRYDQEGRIITYLGEAYLNFGYAGLMLVPFLLGYGLTRFFLRATTGQLSRLSCYLYFVFFSILVQVFRDGMSSLIVFTIVHNMPMLFVWISHKIPGFSQQVFEPPLAAGPQLPPAMGNRELRRGSGG